MFTSAQKKEALLAAVKTAVLGDFVARPLQALLGHHLNSSLTANKEVYEALKAQAKKKMPHVKVKDVQHAIESNFNPLSKEVAAGGLDPHVLAHELGYAEIDTSRLGKLVQNPVTTMAGNLTSPAAMIGGVASGYSDEQSGGDHRLRDVGIGTALHAPQLGYEAAASVKGHRMLKDLGMGPENLGAYRKRMGAAYGTYLLNPVASALNYGVGRTLGRAVARSDREHSKKAGLPTVGLHANEIASNVDILKHLSGAAGKHVEELAHHYKNWHLSPSFAKGQAALTQAAAAPVQQAATAAARATKRTPTIGVGHGVQALQGIQQAVHSGAPVKATPEVLAALGQMPGHALGFSGKYAGVQVKAHVRRPPATARGKLKTATLMELIGA